MGNPTHEMARLKAEIADVRRRNDPLAAQELRNRLIEALRTWRAERSAIAHRLDAASLRRRALTAYGDRMK